MVICDVRTPFAVHFTKRMNILHSLWKYVSIQQLLVNIDAETRYTSAYNTIPSKILLHVLQGSRVKYTSRVHS